MCGSRGGGRSPLENSVFLNLHSKITKKVGLRPHPSGKHRYPSDPLPQEIFFLIRAWRPLLLTAGRHQWCICLGGLLRRCNTPLPQEKEQIANSGFNRTRDPPPPPRHPSVGKIWEALSYIVSTRQVCIHVIWEPSLLSLKNNEGFLICTDTWLFTCTLIADNINFFPHKSKWPLKTRML